MKKCCWFRYISILILCTCFSSCAAVIVNVLKEYPPNSKDCHLDIYVSEKDIPKPFENICILYSQTGTNLFSKKTFEHAIERAMPKACLCGADAIIISAGDEKEMNLVSYGQGSALLTGIRYQ